MSASSHPFFRWLRRPEQIKLSLWVKLLLLSGFIWVVNDLSGLFPSFSSKVQGFAATMLLFVVMGSLGRTVYRVFSVLFVLLLAVYFFTLKLYGPLSYDLMLSMRFTTTAESYGYLSDVLRWGMVLSLVLGISLSITLLFASRIVIRNKYFLGASVLILIALPVAKAQLTGVVLSNKYRDGSSAFSTIPGKLIFKARYDLGLANELVENMTAYDAGYDWSAYSDFIPKQVNIIVIGESSRADFYDMNGFDLFPLTPNMDSTFNYNFSQCISPASVTISSLTRTLFLTDSNFNSIPQANLVSLFRSKGVKTYWISNQGRVGRSDSPFSALGMTCDSSYFLNQASYHTAQEQDQAMLPYLHDILESSSRTGEQVAIFLHLLGSHPPIDNKYDTLTIAYPKRNIVAHYMQSVHETDAFVGEIVDALQVIPKHNMFYFSDHGITYDEKQEYFYHGAGNWENYHVPLVVWSGGDTAHRNIDQGISLSNLIGLVHCFNKGPELQLDSLLSTIRPPLTVLDADNTPRAILKLGSNPIGL